MTDVEAAPPEPADAEDVGAGAAATGTYELLRRRLASQVGDLRARAGELNAERTAHFGGSELALATTERLRTEQSCEARDIVQVGGLLLFGFNVHTGLRATTVADVFSLHEVVRDPGGDATAPVGFTDLPADDPRNFLADERFVHDFGELFTYYKAARLLDLRQDLRELLMVFQTGDTLADVKVFRWTVDLDGTVSYVDDRGERSYTWPDRHDFTWRESTRADHVTPAPPAAPYVALHDRVFVDLVGGRLRIRLEDNTDDGQVVLEERVEHPGQSLSDLGLWSARVGTLTLLRIQPYREATSRYVVVNELTRTATRIDAIGQSAQQLPEDHGIVFPGGYYLQTGEQRLFDTAAAAVDLSAVEFEHVVRSPNGEDVLYHYHGRRDGTSLILTYNLVRREVGTPITGHGYSLFDDGTLVVFKDRGEPSRVHQMQVWTTPFVSDVHYARQDVGDTPLDRVGNAELVRGISDALAVCDLAEPDERDGAPAPATWDRLAAAVGRTLDSYHWLADDALGALADPLREIQATAELIVDEYDRVLETRAATEAAVAQVTAETERLLLDADRPLGAADDHISVLGALRRQAGVVAALEERRYVDTAAVEALGERVTAAIDDVAGRTVDVLAAPGALAGHLDRTAALATRAEGIARAVEAEAVAEEVDALTADLTELADVVTGLDMADTTVRTTILSDVAGVIAGANRARAVLARRRDALAAEESADAFAAEFALLEGALGAALDRATTPQAADEQLARILVTVENLDRSFGHVEAHAAQIDERREEITQAFAARKQQLVDQRAARTSRIARNARRLLDTIGRRAAELGDGDALITYFTTDPMVTRVRAAVDELVGLGDQVAADELAGALAAARSQAERAMRDAAELYADGGAVARFGPHRLSVNGEDAELSVVVGEDAEGRPELEFVLTGTDWREPVDPAAPELAELTAALDPDRLAALWLQRFPSETPELSRAEHLAGVLVHRAVQGAGAGNGSRPTGPTMADLRAAHAAGSLAEVTAAEVRAHYDAGYERGVHDADAARILGALLDLWEQAGSLRFGASSRAAALLHVAFALDEAGRDRLVARAEALAHLAAADVDASAVHTARRSLSAEVAAFADAAGVAVAAGQAGPYLLADLGASRGFSLTVGQTAASLVDALAAALDASGHRTDVVRAMTALADPDGGPGDLAGRFDLARSWLRTLPDAAAALPAELDEAAALVVAGLHGLAPAPSLALESAHADVARTVDGLLSAHPRIVGGSLEVRVDELPARVAAFEADVAPRWRELQVARRRLLARRAAELRLDDLTPKVFAGFVRNGLITDVYLPLIGANLAKQIGAVGSQRADQSGLLLLISPPGYGKTTLVEYVADRLGMLLVKVSGPALGHATTSLDPAAAPDATARAEVEKLLFAFAMGTNVLLYVDDIQHTSAELLQKFISLCDAQRRVDAVRDGQPHTYDLRGKRFAVVMAGNPYTEAGQKFVIPDMLANRADTFNMGDVLTGDDELFAMSYLENALGVNEVLAPLQAARRADLVHLVAAARGAPLVSDRLEGSYTPTELDDMTRVLAHLVEVQQVLLVVNEAYIASAAQADAYRTEPPFGLQGSYRNMAKLAARVVPAMTSEEREALIDDHYVGEAQTLTTGAEQNLLKLAELRGRMDDAQRVRWEQIKAQFRVRNAGEEAGDRIAAQVAGLGQALAELGDKVIAATADRRGQVPPPPMGA